MGRVEISLKKVENNTYRHISFSKRKNGLVKKATLCDIDGKLVIFSPAGKLVLFDGKRRLPKEEGIQDEISPRNVELEDVEKQLACIKSITDAEYHERMLEDTIKRLFS
ncbi:hypothetical protein JRO89_XS09G0115900 [Xanthoceras sorbifolium]|uniref:MADS-box domain-containing protein n=1 Tax=Xanthoceras sorbifolium TaxID=99658 RepID=A0ABQ8HL37_9ROSI|nr:hypothetical protein JRO89_XS09G0115900 [Xanthoceras sorbifolium]